MDLFRHPLWLLGALAAAAGAPLLWSWAESRRRRAAEAFARPEVLPRLFDASALEVRRRRHYLRMGALALLLTSLAAPQWGVELVAVESRSRQVVVAVDTSLSMLAEDLKPNRMEKTKIALSLLIDGLKGSRVGLIAFEGEAFVQCPLTTDLDAVKSFLRRLEAGMLPRRGTAVGKAIELAARQLAKYPGQKAVVLLTDGEDHDSEPLKAAKKAAEQGVQLYILGIGTPEGEPIPVKDAAGNLTGYKKDAQGRTVVSRLGEAGLIRLAAAASGAYWRLSSSEEETTAILERLKGLDKTGGPSGSLSRYRNRYQVPLAAAVLLLIIELLLPETRRRYGGPERRGAKAPLAIGMLALAVTGCGLPADLRLARGNSEYREKEYGAALKQYEKAGAEDPRTGFGSGAALYRMGDFTGAEKAFAEAQKRATEAAPGLLPDAHYNRGNALYRREEMQEAAEAYKRCLLLDPGHEDCRYNLVLALRRPPPSEKKDSPNDPKPQPPRDDKKDEKGGSPPPPPRPQAPQGGGGGGLSREEAERLLQAVKERERAAQENRPVQVNPGGPQNGEGGEDW